MPSTSQARPKMRSISASKIDASGVDRAVHPVRLHQHRQSFAVKRAHA
jgi:hypothetical protein